MKTLLALLLLLPTAFLPAQSTAKKEMYRLRSGKSLEKALEDPLNAKFVSAYDYADSVFPNAQLAQLKNVEHLIVKARFCRKTKLDSLLPPLKVRIDTVALKQLTKLKYLELSQFDFSEFPTGLCALGQLKGLSMGLCFIDTLPEEIARMKSLELLELRLNELTDLPASMATMDSLVELDLANNDLSVIPPVILRMPHLQSLILSNIETDMESNLGWSWPYFTHINYIRYDEQLETLMAVLKMPAMKSVYVQVNTKEKKEQLKIALRQPALLSKIVWRVEPQVKM